MTTTTTTLTVNDLDSGVERSFANTADGWAQAFEMFATAEDRVGLAEALDEGCVYESWSGKSTSPIERDREPLRYWQILCSTIETDNQSWEVA